MFAMHKNFVEFEWIAVQRYTHTHTHTHQRAYTFFMAHLHSVNAKQKKRNVFCANKRTTTVVNCKCFVVQVCMCAHIRRLSLSHSRGRGCAIPFADFSSLFFVRLRANRFFFLPSPHVRRYSLSLSLSFSRWYYLDRLAQSHLSKKRGKRKNKKRGRRRRGREGVLRKKKKSRSIDPHCLSEQQSIYSPIDLEREKEREKKGQKRREKGGKLLLFKSQLGSGVELRANSKPYLCLPPDGE